MIMDMSMFYLVIAIVFYSMNSIDGLRIGVSSSARWMPIVEKALSTLEDNNTTSMFELVDLGVGETRTAYDKINKVHSNISTVNLHAVIGPFESDLGLVTESLNIPYLSTTPVPKKLNGTHTYQMLPHMRLSAKAILDVAQAFSWDKIGVFYDDDNGVKVLEQLMTNHTMIVRAWRLSTEAKGPQIRNALIEMRKVLVTRVVVLCNRGNTHLLLRQARDFAMLSTPPYRWLFYDPGADARQILTQYDEINTNFTVVKLLEFNDTLRDSKLQDSTQIEYALAMDCLHLLNTSYTALLDAALATSTTLTNDSIRLGLNTAIKNNLEYGHTGHLEFDNKGRRSNFTFTLTAILGNFHYLRGHWYSRPIEDQKRLVLYNEQIPFNITGKFPLYRRRVRVVMIEEAPFTMKKRDHMLRRGNDKFKGFAVDLIKEVAKDLGFEYDIYLVHDGKFGSKLSNGDWNGMIGELLAGNATMSVAPLSINAQREEAVDFTKPFKTRYISVLIKVPKKETSYFEFLSPLSPVVWICTLAAFVIVSMVLFALEKMGRDKLDDSPDNVNITVRESFWFIFGSLLQGNTDSTPCTIPGRILTSAWWFFALILISSYTANLAAFLTVKKINTPIKSVTDLAMQNNIKYGTVKDSGIMSFFKNTDIEHFSKMWAQMSEIEPDSMVDNTTEGFRKVRQEDYAFFWDTTVNKYITIKDCDVMEIGPAFDPKGFGIGVPPGATYRDALSMTILKLSDNGKLHELETKWWDAGSCPEMTSKATDETSSLQIENVAGVFFILVGGIVIAAIVCLGEYFTSAMIKASKLAVGKKVSEKSKDKTTRFAASPVREEERDSFI